MKMRLSDFAELHRINVRTAQIHIKENQAELEGHIERRGKQGTWIDEFVQEFLLQKIQLPSKEEVYMPTVREAALMAEIVEVTKRLADAERRAGENAEAAGKVLLLEESKKEQTDKIDALTRENAVLSAEKGDAIQKALDAENEAENAKMKLTEARKQIEELKNASLMKRLFGWKKGE